MNIIEQFKERKVIATIYYYGSNDIGTAISAQAYFDNQDIIWNTYSTNTISTLDDYINYIFLDALTKYKEYIPYVIKEKRTDFESFISKVNTLYQGYHKPQIVKYIRNKYLDIYQYHDNEGIYIEPDLKQFTTNYIGNNSNCFDENIMEYIMKEHPYDIIDNFEYWITYFLKKPSKISSLFNKGSIEKIFNIRSEEIYSILEQLYTKKNLKKKDNEIIDILYSLVHNRCTQDSSGDSKLIYMNYYILGDFLKFLMRVKSKYVYDIEKLFNQSDDTLYQYILDNGESISFKIDISKFMNFFKNENIPFINRILSLTHTRNHNNKLISFLELAVSSSKNQHPIADSLARPGFQENDYFTNYTLNVISSYLFEIKARIGMIFESSQDTSNYLSYIYSELKYICKNNNTTVQIEGFDKYVEMLTQYISDYTQLLSVTNTKNETSFETTTYSFAMFLCGFIEQILKLIYFFQVKTMDNIGYISKQSITLGRLLSLKNCNQPPTIIKDILGIDQMRCLEYFLLQTSDTNDKIGANIRNDLAHLSGKTMKHLNENLIMELLAYFSSIINSCVIYYLEQGKEK